MGVEEFSLIYSIFKEGRVSSHHNSSFEVAQCFLATNSFVFFSFPMSMKNLN
jgi:hypothetical protein